MAQVAEPNKASVLSKRGVGYKGIIILCFKKHFASLVILLCISQMSEH
jgi:hypothetical protein